MLPSPSSRRTSVAPRGSLLPVAPEEVGPEMLQASMDLVRLADVMLSQDQCAEAEMLWTSAIERCVHCHDLLSRTQAEVHL